MSPLARSGLARYWHDVRKAALGEDLGGLPVPRVLRQIERRQLLAQDFRVEERFGFESHLPEPRTSNFEPRTVAELQDRSVPSPS